MNNIEAICKTVDENPDDEYLWGVLADALEEVGDERSVGLRQLIAENRRPDDYRSQLDCEEFPWSWWVNYDFNIDDRARLPVFHNVRAESEYSEHCKDFLTLSVTLLVAAEAYVMVNVK